MATTNNSDGHCACGHILDVSTDQLCRHCARGHEQHIARLGAATSDHDLMCRCRACNALKLAWRAR